MAKRFLTFLLLASILLQLVPAVVPRSEAAVTYTDADWEQLIQNYKNNLLGGPNVDWSDNEIQKIVGQNYSSGLSKSGISYEGGRYWRSLEQNRSNPDRIFWSTDITVEVSSDTMRRQFIGLFNMARAYGTPGTNYTYKDTDGTYVTVLLYQNAELRDAIFYGLQKGLRFYCISRWNEYLSSPNRGTVYNWWDYAYGTPLEVLRTLLILYPYASTQESDIATQYADTCLYMIDKMRPNVGKTQEDTYGFRRTRLNICSLIATVSRNTELMEETRTNLKFFMTENFDLLEGVKEDGSYICHRHWPLEGMYGRGVLIERIVETYQAMAGTVFALDSADIMFDWMMKTFKPVMQKGMIMVPFNGRTPHSGDAGGLTVLQGALMLDGSFDAASNLQLRQFIRTIVMGKTEAETQKAYAYYAVKLNNVNLVQTLKNILLDTSIPDSETEYANMRYCADRAVQHQADYTVALSMSSSRIAIPESINGENRYGWFEGDGALYIYNSATDYDTDQYGVPYRKYANLYRVAGTTEEDSTIRQPWSNRNYYSPGQTYSYDEATKTEIWTQEKNKDGVDAATFVGGVELADKYIVSAMDFEAYSWSEAESKEEVAYIDSTSQKNELEERNKMKQVVISDLTAKKSYFMFDDEIVCIGSDIDFTTRDTTVNTYVDNRELLEKATVNGTTVLGTEDIYVDGTLLEKTNAFSEPKAYTNPKWVHQENFGGYYFPTGGNVYVNKTYRQSSNDGDDTNDDFNKYNIYVGPTNESHSFFELWVSHGEKPVNGSYSYVMLPEKSVAETESYTKKPDVKVLKNTTSLHVVQETTLGITAMVFWKAGTYGDITVDKPMIVMVQEKDGKYLLSVSDPTQKLTSGTITINRPLNATKLDSKIGVSGTVKTVLTINFGGSKGKTIAAEFSTATEGKLLMFDFNPNTGAKYQSNTYGFVNYSKANYWAMSNLASDDSRKVTISGGMMTVPITTKANALWTFVQATDLNGGYASASNAAKSNVLNFDPSEAEIFQIRFKLTDAAVVSNSSPNVSINYLVDGGDMWSNYGTVDNNPYRESIVGTFSAQFADGGSKEGQYVTITVPLTGKKLPTYEKIVGITLQFGYLNGGTATVDYFYIGPKTDSLYFGFDNGGGTDRYNEGAYGGHDYDAQNGAAWATACTDQVGKYFIVDNAEGTLTLYTSCDYYGTLGKNESYGAYLSTSSASGYYGWPGNTNRHALSYDPSEAEILEVRFKTDDLVPQNGMTPRLVMLTILENDGVATSDYTTEKAFTLQNGEYQILRIPVTDSVKGADYIKSLGLRFCYTKAAEEGSAGKITVDYIYIGKKTNAPSNLYFGFDGTREDRERYSTDVYGNTDFDDGKNWWISGEADSKTIASGAMTLTADARLADTTWPALYFKTAVNGANASYPLEFTPERAEYFQIRFKMKNFRVGEQVTASGTKTIAPYLKLTYFEEGSTTSVSATSDYKDHKAFINADKYITVTLPINEAMAKTEGISSIRVYFGGIESIADTQGVLTVDYIYIGAKEDLPTPQYTLTFRNADGTVLATQTLHKGETASYTGATPTRAYDETNHYTFSGWDKALSAVAADTTFTAQFTATAHSYTYSKLDSTDHRAVCACGYSREEAHSYENGTCPCGEAETTEPTVVQGIKIGHSLSLAGDISVNYVTMKSQLDAYDSFCLVCEIPIYEGDQQVGTEQVTVDPVENGDYYYFTLEGLTAVQMNDVVKATLYMTGAGKSYSSVTDSYSIGQYAYAQFKKTSASRSLKALCADLLRYGAAAQAYKGYRTDAPVDADMTEEQCAYLSDMDAVTFGSNNTTLNDVENPAVTWLGKGLNLESKVALKFILDASGYTGSLADLSMHVVYTDYTGTERTAVISELEPYSADKNWYAFSFDGLLAAELRTVVSAAVYEGDTQVSPTTRYSADTYGNNKNGALLDLCKALFAYSDTALDFFRNE